VGRPRRLALTLIGMGVGVAGAGVGFAFGHTPVAAATNCANNTCRWTQGNNGNWPNGSSNPNCSPCVSWPPSQSGGIADLSYRNPWRGASGDQAMFDHEVNWAIGQWSSLQYYSPVFSEDNCSNCNDTLTFAATSLSTSLCGRTTYNYSVTQGGQADLTSATVFLNTNVGYTDGANNVDGVCDLRWTLLHEDGHVFGEGHSGVPSDLMYKDDNNVETIDADAQNMMAQVYGTYEAGCTSDCGHSALTLPQAPVTLHPMTLAQIEQAVKDKLAAAQNSAVAAEQDGSNIADNATPCHGVRVGTVCSIMPPP
jgi:hypothetical protein